MRLTYDPRDNTAYIRFGDRRAGFEAVRVGDELIVNMTPDGTVHGIELLNANKQLQRSQFAGLVVIDEATGERAELSLALGEQGVQPLKDEQENPIRLSTAEIRALARLRARALADVSRQELARRFEEVSETILAQAIAAGTAIEGDWQGD